MEYVCAHCGLELEEWETVELGSSVGEKIVICEECDENLDVARHMLDARKHLARDARERSLVSAGT